MMGSIPPFYTPGGAFGVTGNPASSWTFTKTAEASAAEVVATFKVSDGGVAKAEIANDNTTDAFAAMALRLTGSGSTSPNIVGIATTDSGVNAVLTFIARNTVPAVITTRPLYQWRNHTTNVMSMSAAGGLSITGGTTPSLTVGASGTAITQMRVYTPTIDPASVAANTTAEQTFTVAGLTTADKVIVNKPTNTAGLGIVNVRVSAADTLAITFGNFTALAIDAASEVYSVIAIRS